MQDTAQKPEALSRTWALKVAHKLDGAVISAHAHTVTLSRDYVGGPLSAEVDGEAADVARAVRLIEWAYEQEVAAEVLAPLPAPVIGKARAARLHRLMGRAGLFEHYGFAARALGREVYSLAALTEGEARKVWQFVQHMTAPAGTAA